MELLLCLVLQTRDSSLLKRCASLLPVTVTVCCIGTNPWTYHPGVYYCFSIDLLYTSTPCLPYVWCARICVRPGVTDVFVNVSVDYVK